MGAGGGGEGVPGGPGCGSSQEGLQTADSVAGSRICKANLRDSSISSKFARYFSGLGLSSFVFLLFFVFLIFLVFLFIFEIKMGKHEPGRGRERETGALC